MRWSQITSKLFTLLAFSIGAAVVWHSSGLLPVQEVNAFQLHTESSPPLTKDVPSDHSDAYQRAMAEATGSRDEMLRIVSETRIQNRWKEYEVSQVLQGSIEFTPAIDLGAKLPRTLLDPDEVWHRQMKAAAAILHEQIMPWR